MIETAAEFAVRFIRESAERDAVVKRWIELGLKTRTANALVNDWIKDLARLADKTDEELLRIPHIGKAGLRDIRRFVSAPPKAT